jgi:hypothetical protein
LLNITVNAFVALLRFSETNSFSILSCQNMVFLMPLQSWRFVGDTCSPHTIFLFIPPKIWGETLQATAISHAFIAVFSTRPQILYFLGLRSHPFPIFTNGEWSGL